ncbi:MAG: Ycf51 family protein [Elainellaceae cyanobacterium]
MPTPSDFLALAKWSGILTLVFGAVTTLGFLFGWGIRFRLVGATGLMGVLTGGIFALGLVPFTRTVVPGAIKFTRVYDNGATRAVIAVPPTITESELEATLKQAASNLFSPGRLGGGPGDLVIKARTVLHPEPGLSQPLVLGQVERSLSKREDQDMAITTYPDALAQLPPTPAAESAD